MPSITITHLNQRWLFTWEKLHKKCWKYSIEKCKNLCNITSLANIDLHDITIDEKIAINYNR